MKIDCRRPLTGADPGILKTGGAKISLALNPAPHHGWGVKKMVGGGSVLRKSGGACRGLPPLDPPLPKAILEGKMLYS